MSKQIHFIAQIKEEEEKVTQLLQKAEMQDGDRVSKASDDAQKLVDEAEEAARKIAIEKITKAKEGAKDDYKKILVDADNERRDIIESGTKNLTKAQKLVKDEFVGLFQ